MPRTQPAPAVPGNQQPRPVPLTTLPSLRRPPPANRPRTPRPINSRRREVKAPYPDLPETPHSSGGRVTSAEFNRAWFLRRLAGHRAADRLITDAYKRNADLPTKLFLISAQRDAENVLVEGFSDWMESCGGMAGPGFKPAIGSAA
ncbi:hypothetical protein [Variovorax sp. RCC_210]|uniref:hypothetical protein n=1 Tax=Variovorax sp. RCC_210 TaxID=3239217 RepID=UPI0035269899